MPDARFKYVNIDIETYDKLTRQAEDNYRTIPAQIRYLVDMAERQANAVEVDQEYVATAR